MQNLHKKNKRRSPILAFPLPSAYWVLTSEFGMGSGEPPVVSSPHLNLKAYMRGLFLLYYILFSDNSLKTRYIYSSNWLGLHLNLSPRSISSGQLNTSRYLHLHPINLIVYKGTYLKRVGILVLEFASNLDAFSSYRFRT